MQNISIRTKVGQVEGTCDPRFSGVVDEFVTNFEARGEVGASCAIQVEGKTLVDIWGGVKKPGGDAWPSCLASNAWRKRARRT